MKKNLNFDAELEIKPYFIFLRTIDRFLDIKDQRIPQQQ